MDSLRLGQISLMETCSRREDEEGGILMAFPAEVRTGIYQQLLVSPEPILIRKPRTRTFRELAFSSGRSSILYINKKIHCEAIRVFFTYNTFAVGNGVDEGEATLAGLRTFVTFMPADFITLISKLQFNVYLRQAPVLPSQIAHILPSGSTSSESVSTAIATELELQWAKSEAIPFDSGIRQSLGTPAEAEEIRKMYQIVSKRFTGLKYVTFDWLSRPLKLVRPARMLPGNAIVTVLSNAIAAVLHLPKFRELRMWEDECVFTESILERTLEVKAGSGKAVDFEHLRFVNGTSGRIRGGDKEQREIRIWWKSSGGNSLESEE